MAVLRIRTPVVGQEERVFEWDGQPITLGRETTCDVVLLEQAASRHHARLERTDTEILLHDEGSANGTWVGDNRITSCALHDGEIFRIGETTIQLVLDPFRQSTLVGAPTPPPPPSASPETPIGREALGSGPTLAADEAAALARKTAPSSTATISPASPRGPASTMQPADEPELGSPSAPSVYSLGKANTLPGSSPGPGAGPNWDGPGPDESAPYSIGDALGPEPAGPGIGPRPSSPATYSLGEPAPNDPVGGQLGLGMSSSPSVYSLGDAAPPASEPKLIGPGSASSPSVYTLGDAAPPDRGPAGPRIPPTSAPSVYSLGDAAPPAEPMAFGSEARSSEYTLGRAVDPPRDPLGIGLLSDSSPSVYSLGDVAPLDTHGPDAPITSSAALGGPPPTPAPLGVLSSGALGAPPPEPAPFGGPPLRPPIELGSTPAAAAPPSPQPLVPPSGPQGPLLHPATPHPATPHPATPHPEAFSARVDPAMGPRSARSSWEWVDADVGPRPDHGRAAGPTLWLGVGLFLGGLIAMAAALAAGYDPADLLTLLGGALAS